MSNIEFTYRMFLAIVALWYIMYLVYEKLFKMKRDNYELAFRTSLIFNMLMLPVGYYFGNFTYPGHLIAAIIVVCVSFILKKVMRNVFSDYLK